MSGSSGQGVVSIARDSSKYLTAADRQNVSGVLSGLAWNGSNITYSFPTSSSFYGTQATYGDPAPFNGFAVLTTQQQNEVKRAFALLASYTNLTFTQITETSSAHATIRLANSTSPSTAYAYYPSNSATGGDVFYGGTGKRPVMGNFDSGQATLHEIGHALGLKHGQDTTKFGAMNADRLDIEFSLMNYPNYIGSTEGYATASTSAQTYMMYDIAALQYMYGANFSKAGQYLTYRWSATTGEQFINNVSQGVPVDNHIFETIWTAGATSTYDLSNFSQSQVDDMNAGGWMKFSTAQLADLNAYAPSKPNGEIYARGDIYNALMYNGDTRSLIDNLITGSGADTITGNIVNNRIDAGAGADAINGGAGLDTSVYHVNRSAATITRNAGGTVTISDATDGVDMLTSVEWAAFSDQTVWIGRAKKDFGGNGDGVSDVLFRNAVTGDIGYYQLNSSGGSMGWRSLGASSPAYDVAGIGDFNGDGISDVLFRNAATGDTGFYQINSSGAMQAWRGIGGSSTAYAIVGVGDFNTDGVSDILYRNSANGDTGFYQLTGAGTLEGWHDIGLSSLAYTVMGVGDLNGDGVSDVLFENTVTGDTGYYALTSTGTLSSWVGVAVASTSYSLVGVGDFNGDGLSDVLFRNAMSGDVGFYQMSPSGLPATWRDIGYSSTDYSVAGTGDYNGDGVWDVLFRSASGDTGFYQLDTSGSLAGWRDIGVSSTGFGIIS